LIQFTTGEATGSHNQSTRVASHNEPNPPALINKIRILQNQMKRQGLTHWDYQLLILSWGLGIWGGGGIRHIILILQYYSLCTPTM
jgi:hypothetical protein